ncbi:APC family permease [Hymenobacter arizonensis]|uniref:Amino acid/polyamine/organocation transporter, APC superfamily n=1 Tax=Hymenobacter arizonensis TaxID=1227077 RepID=A0A1I5Z1F5_HYMAR|nr:APC family permease [Hymenobacter arizonensis]SFQ50252.1 amino acid/polyamine/organocation transporter, APC superfamily [Hymenobacter arizonensis]
MKTPSRIAGLRRLVGLGFGLAVAVGGTAGTGVLTSPGELARALGGPGPVLVLWVVGGLYTLLAANTMAELAGRLPQAGGWYAYAEAAFGEFPAVAVAWADWTSSCVTGALVALLLGEYLAQLLPLAIPHGPTWLAVLAVLALCLVQFRGLREGSRAQEITAAVLLLGVVGLLVASAWLPGPPPVVARVTPAAGLTAVSVVAALQVVVFAYDGWYGPIYFAEETPQPGRTLSRALLWGVAAVLGLYFVLNATLLRVLPFGAIQGSELPLAELAATLFGPLGRKLVLSLGVVAMVGVLNSVLLMATRVLFALGRAGHLPARLARVHGGGTPRPALVVAGVLTLGLLLSGTVAELEAITSVLFVGYYVVGFAALFKLRRLQPAQPGDFQAWGHPWSTGLLVALSVAFLVMNAVSDTGHALVALALVAGAWPLWRWARKSATVAE